MSAEIGPDDVAHVARLAHLELAPGELEQFAGDLASILSYVAQLEELDLDDVPPSTHAIPLTLRLREDVHVKTLSRAEVLATAPSTDGTYFDVPRAVDGGN